MTIEELQILLEIEFLEECIRLELIKLAEVRKNGIC